MGNKMGISKIRRLPMAVFSVLLIASVVFAFWLFIKDSNRRATLLSSNYVKDATVQSGQRIDEVLSAGKNEIQMTATLFEETLSTDTVKKQDLKILSAKSEFDYIEYVDQDGMSMSMSGESEDVSAHACYKDGMQGNTGVDVVLNSENTDENLVIFYTPLLYKKQVIGVLMGHYRENRMKNILYSTFFDEDARTFLCMKDGTVIASHNGDTSPDSIFEKDSFNSKLDSDVEAGLRKALSERTEYEFQYEGTGGTGNAYVLGLEESDWMLVQTFPSQITSKMVQDANRAGINLLIELVLIFVVCFVVAQFVNLIQKKRLLRENREKTYVVDGITRLFGTFVLVDLQEGTYEYIAGAKPRYATFPPQGEYRFFRDLIVNMIEDEEEGKRLAPLLLRSNLRQELDETTPYLRYEYRIKHKEERWDSLSIICLERDRGLASKLLFTYQDVTKLKQREQQSYAALQEAYQAVESANHAKSDFLSNMSHDIRTPMNAIMGMTAIAAMNLDDRDRVKDCLNKITVSSQHLLGLINEVLDMSKIESGKMSLANEEFNLSDVVENIVTIFHSQTQEKNQHFKVEIADIKHEEVVGDSMRLQQIFSNILGNAVKFTPEGGSIIFRIKEKASRIRGCGCYEFVFEDTGIGMEQAFMDKIFDPFVRAEDSMTSKTEGTGLGMPIVKNIVQMMNGDIQIESQPQKGSRFTVTVYLQLNHFQKDDIRGLEELKVLVADDDQCACESACVILNEIGMKADWVLSGDEAVQSLLQANEAGTEYAAVILDWKMPGKDGIETAREIREKVGKDIPIIILSAYDYSFIEQEARQAGVNGFISKPLFRSRLVYLLKSLVLHEGEEAAEVSELQTRDYSGKRILLVEDNELNMEIAEELLMQVGLQVDKAANGREAVERLNETEPDYYDLVFMDIQMPEMNGYEATEAIRASEREDLRTLPIVAMTADAFVDDVKHAKNVGMNGHVAKPVEIDKLIQALDEWVTP